MPSWTSTEPSDESSPVAWITGLVIACVFGLALRLTAARSVTNFFPIMSIGFLCLGPAVIGFLAVYYSGKTKPSILQATFLPWPAVLLTCALSAVLSLEGWICIVFLTPVALIFGSIGGLTAGHLLTRGRRNSLGITSCIAALPLLCMAVESHLAPPTRLRTVENSISIRANADAVWQQIQSVPPITPSELQPTWTHRIGFPRPVAAVLSHPGVGGVRTATFEHGLTFHETVTDWQPSHQLAFSIKADTAHIPPTTLDEHVTIGGPYFDVLDGEYRIEPQSDGTVLLHLTSHQRLSTDFNGYAGLWSDAVMSSLQQSILQVIQHRCETQQQIAFRNTNQ
jgi:hypothetical protein